jgi:hypothetical protein
MIPLQDNTEERGLTSVPRAELDLQSQRPKIVYKLDYVAIGITE